MNWADHCDSDSDSDDGLHPVRLSSNNLQETTGNDPDAGISFDDEDSIDADEELELEEEKIPFPPPIDMENLPDNFPSEAPYSAYVGNVAFNIKTDQAFAEKIEGLVKFRYQNTKRVKVINARFGMDRSTNQRKGFGYVEFETPEELMLFLNINDGHSSLHNRIVNIDIARPPQKRNNNNRRNNNNNRNNNRGGGDNSNGKLPEIDGSKFRGGLKSKERTALKLEPRSKPTENKPSDMGDWRSEKATLPERKPKNNRKKNNNGKKNEKKDNKKDNNATPAVAPKKVEAPLPVKEDKKNFTKVSNAFAAFGFDSDSDSD